MYFPVFHEILRCNFWHAKLALAPPLMPRGGAIFLVVRFGKFPKQCQQEAEISLPVYKSNNSKQSPCGLLTLLKTRSFCATARINYQNIALTSLIRPVIVNTMKEMNEEQHGKRKQIGVTPVCIGVVRGASQVVWYFS